MTTLVNPEASARLARAVATRVSDTIIQQRLRGSLASYHGTLRPWAVPRTPDPRAHAFGVELETATPDRPTMLAGLSPNVLAERDGSLDSDDGVEIIGHPYTVREYQMGRTPWSQTIKYLAEHGCQTPNRNGYGLHVSISRAKLSLAAQRIGCWIIHHAARDVSIAVARRQSNWANYYAGSPRHIFDSSMENHGSATCIRSHRIECRIFAAGVGYKTLSRAIAYVNAVFQTAQQLAPTNDTDGLDLTAAKARETLFNFIAESRDLAPFLLRRGKLPTAADVEAGESTDDAVTDAATPANVTGGSRYALGLALLILRGNFDTWIHGVSPHMITDFRVSNPRAFLYAVAWIVSTHARNWNFVGRSLAEDMRGLQEQFQDAILTLSRSGEHLSRGGSHMWAAIVARLVRDGQYTYSELQRAATDTTLSSELQALATAAIANSN